MGCPASQKLWRVIREPSGLYYEIKLKGVIIDRIPIEYPALNILKEEGIISDALFGGEE
jgi:hypothetical protein